MFLMQHKWNQTWLSNSTHVNRDIETRKALLKSGAFFVGIVFLFYHLFFKNEVDILLLWQVKQIFMSY